MYEELDLSSEKYYILKFLCFFFLIPPLLIYWLHHCLAPGCKVKNRIKGNKYAEIEECVEEQLHGPANRLHLTAAFCISGYFSASFLQFFLGGYIPALSRSTGGCPAFMRMTQEK